MQHDEFREFDIHVRTLRDNQQFSDPEGEASKFGIYSDTLPFFAIIWESGTNLAYLMEDYPGTVLAISVFQEAIYWGIATSTIYYPSSITPIVI